MVPLRICVSDLITHRAERVTGGRTTFVIVAVSQRKQRRTASDLAVLSYVEPSAARISAEDETSLADNSLQRTAKSHASDDVTLCL